ncbi:hypothetical protein [Burkholderia vietnamiensis]|uniref:hypothetical protein n=1 Tax=Burkholderia vietnamiensis TaxID=60552 RepID=UPI001B98C39A|nr:hypothetical protein [Burkholderia vietnamiensis]MBR8147036.1 hypothetical protein [Burkholderia vietnamiensis]
MSQEKEISDFQPAAAPIDDLRQEVLRLCRLFLDDEQDKYNAKAVMTQIFSLAAAPTPSPADEQAAFEAALDRRAKSAGFEVGRITECELDNAWWGWQAARAASANEMGAKGADALAHEVWSAAQRAPGEGIEDAVQRVAAILSRSPLK